MKRKVILICCVCICVMVIGVVGLPMPERLGNINRNIDKTTSTKTTVSFVAQEGDRIKVSFLSEVREGTLDIILYDSEGTVVKKLDKADKLKKIYKLNESDTYTLVADYKEFKGEFKVVVYDITKAGKIYQRCRVF